MFKLLVTVAVLLGGPLTLADELTNLDWAPQDLKNRIEFSYEPASQRPQKCVHYKSDIPYGWKVKCKDELVNKVFTIHLVIRKVLGPRPPMSRFQVLYWVSNPRPEKTTSEHTGSSLWFRTRKNSNLHSFSLGQAVDNDYAHLVLNFQ